MSKIKSILYLMAVTLFFINPVNADTIVNGDFDINLDGWNHGACSVWQSPGKVFNYDDCNINQDNVDFSGDTLTFWYGMNGGATLVIKAGTTIIYNQYLSSSGNYQADTSGISGTHTLYFDVLGQSAYWLDNIHTDYVHTIEINYNPDVDITNTKPLNISYKLNDTFEGHWARIYSWNAVEIQSSEPGNDTYYDVWLAGEEEEVTWIDNNLKYMTTTDYFHSYSWPELNISYAIAIYNTAGRTPGIDPPNFEDDPNIYDWDFIQVNYSWNGTPPPDPTPQPTPNATPSPTPSPTPTPEPTGTPQPDPESNNETLNTSFSNTYYILVNDTVDGFFIPVYNFTDYIAQPITMLNDTLWNFSTEMNTSFNSTSSHLGLSTNMLLIIMQSFPQKIINVFTYYLIWVIILLIFKAET